MKYIIKLLIGAIALLIAAYVVPGITVTSFYVALVVAFVWGFISFFIKPILLILTLPINILTLGLFSFILNGLLFWFISTFVKGFNITGFVPAVLGALVVSLLSWLGDIIFIRN